MPLHPKTSSLQSAFIQRSRNKTLRLEGTGILLNADTSLFEIMVPEGLDLDISGEMYFIDPHSKCDYSVRVLSDREGKKLYRRELDGTLQSYWSWHGSVHATFPHADRPTFYFYRQWSCGREPNPDWHKFGWDFARSTCIHQDTFKIDCVQSDSGVFVDISVVGHMMDDEGAVRDAVIDSCYMPDLQSAQKEGILHLQKWLEMATNLAEWDVWREARGRWCTAVVDATKVKQDQGFKSAITRIRNGEDMRHVLETTRHLGTWDRALICAYFWHDQPASWIKGVEIRFKNGLSRMANRRASRSAREARGRQVNLRR